MGVTEIADGVWRCGTEQINWYLVEEDGRLTMVDAGLPGYRAQLDEALLRVGRRLDDLAAIVLTHGHPDHVGFAEALRAQTGTTVYVHEDDAELARTQKMHRRERSFLPYLARRQTWRLISHCLRNGRPKAVREVKTFTDGTTIDVPGHPRAMHAPGHTDGSCALHLAGAGVLLTGDVMCERNPFLARRGPQIMPAAFNVSSQQALDSLDRLNGIEAPVIGFGHGDPWTGGVPSATAQARAAGPS